jgi:hypothetical protein
MYKKPSAQRKSFLEKQRIKGALYSRQLNIGKPQLPRFKTLEN